MKLLRSLDVKVAVLREEADTVTNDPFFAKQRLKIMFLLIVICIIYNHSSTLEK